MTAIHWAVLAMIFLLFFVTRKMRNNVRPRKNQLTAAKKIVTPDREYVATKDSLVSDLESVERSTGYSNEREWFRKKWESSIHTLPIDDLRNPALMCRVLRQIYCLKQMDGSITSNRDCVLDAVRFHGSQLEFADPKFWSDKEIAVAAISTSISAINFVAPEMLSDRDFFLAALKRDNDRSVTEGFERCRWYDSVDSPYKSDPEILMVAEEDRKWREDAESWLSRR